VLLRFLKVFAIGWIMKVKGSMVVQAAALALELLCGHGDMGMTLGCKKHLAGVWVTTGSAPSPMT